tara:strand:- start:1920 stop:2423 length:504 start_codon:yes stop_codon:yes gene_type:complete
MKSHFIKDTNEKYSIREDGILISHKKKGDKIIKTFKGFAVLSVNNRRINVFITYLIKTYFNYFLCKSCNTKVQGNDKKRTLCNKCKISVKESNAKSFKNITDLGKKKRLLYKRKAILELKVFYIKDKLKVTNINIPKEIIESKRQQLLLHRALKQIKDEHTNKHSNK